MFKVDREEPYWQSISDLMTGLMVVFVFVCIAFLYQINKAKKDYNIVREQITIALVEEFKMENYVYKGIEIDPKTLKAVFREPSVYFDDDSSYVKPAFRNLLDDFFPRYCKVLKKFDKHIQEIRIEGHASKSYKKNPNSVEAYYYNMYLSQSRAFNVLTYCYGATPEDYRPWLKSKLRANGASSSNAIDDEAASRCVVISIVRNADEVVQNIGTNAE